MRPRQGGFAIGLVMIWLVCGGVPGEAQNVRRIPRGNGGQRQSQAQIVARLHEAMNVLEQVLPIYDGHRHRAIDLVQLAIREVRGGANGNSRERASQPMPIQQQINGISHRPEKHTGKLTVEQIQMSNRRMITAAEILQAALPTVHNTRPDAAQAVVAALEQIQLGLQFVQTRGRN